MRKLEKIRQEYETQVWSFTIYIKGMPHNDSIFLMKHFCIKRK
jgi:hypothetical protein